MIDANPNNVGLPPNSWNSKFSVNKSEIQKFLNFEVQNLQVNRISHLQMPKQEREY